MTEDQKREAEKLDELIEIYKIHVDDDLNRRDRKLTILWSFISIFYVLGDLGLNVAHTGNEEEVSAIVRGILITGITESKLLIFLIIILAYFVIKFIFSTWKLHRQLNGTRLLKHFWTLHKGEFTTGFVTSPKPSYLELHCSESFSESIKEEVLENTVEPKQPDDESISANRKRYDIQLFMYYYRIVGSLEYIFAPLIFPALLSVCAIVLLAVELFC